MNFFIIMGTLCIFLDVNAETRLAKCKGYRKPESQKHLIFSDGIVCTKISCDWSVDSTCKNGTSSEVLQWETDIFEIGFERIKYERPREIVIKIDLNEDYYIEIKVISDEEKRTVKVILNECSHTEKQCLENRNFTHHDVDIVRDRTLVAVGFRKDEKMNFASVSKGHSHATNLFGKDNVYEFKTPGFYFNTDDTMKITVYSKFDKNYKYDGLEMFLPTSVGGLFFDEDGYLVHDKYSCDTYYNNPDEEKGIAYIIREYFNNSEDWKAPPVEWTRYATVPYFDENGMKVERDQMLVKEEKNPNFDEKKLIRKGCKYVEKPHIDTTALKDEPTLTEDEVTEATTTTTLTEDETTETTIPDDLTEESVSTPMPLPTQNKDHSMDSLPEGGREITINEEAFMPKLDSSEPNINLNAYPPFLIAMSRELFKKELLIKIRSKKEILFGSFSHTLSEEKKRQAWIEITEFAKSVHLIPKDKEWTYARDVLWENIKKATMAKRDGITKTGKGGMGKYTEVDELVLDILGKEPPLICGLGVRESMASTECVNEDPEIPDGWPEPVPHQRSQHEEKRLQIDDDQCDSEKDKLMKESFRIKIFKTKLEILELETKLGLPRSKFTKELSDNCMTWSTSNVLEDLPGTSSLIVTEE